MITSEQVRKVECDYPPCDATGVIDYWDGAPEGWRFIRVPDRYAPRDCGVPGHYWLHVCPEHVGICLECDGAGRISAIGVDDDFPCRECQETGLVA